MCTITVLRTGDLLRLAFNRDERRDRSPAHPPFISRSGALEVIAPQDPDGRGTWIAANGAGIIFALLNGQAQPGAPPPRMSRGQVIPRLAGSSSLEEVTYRVEEIPVLDFAPFRLVAVDGRDALELSHRDGEWTAAVAHLGAPLLFTSSALGDAIVDGPRRMLFEQMLGVPWDLVAHQDAFHGHRWRDRPAVSVHMSRPDACTVSTTVVEVTGKEVRMVYQPAHCDIGVPVGLIIDRQQVEDAAPRARRQYAAV